jgi:hypothetical protein
MRENICHLKIIYYDMSNFWTQVGIMFTLDEELHKKYIYKILDETHI